jgi:uncharacterized cupin superfamily protein
MGEIVAIKVVNFQKNQGQYSELRLADSPERLVSGDPTHKTTVHFANETSGFAAGTWTATPGKFRVAADRDEFCHIVSGHARLVDDNNDFETFKTGDAFVIPNGFIGYWDVIETTTKHFAIYKYPSS